VIRNKVENSTIRYVYIEFQGLDDFF
jgi:hypothetical protein